ncbi:hypothetical protein [Thermicanus aegyptius]|nr:hypothetical protein [Thermicanus aegyptius]
MELFNYINSLSQQAAEGKIDFIQFGEGNLQDGQSIWCFVDGRNT